VIVDVDRTAGEFRKRAQSAAEADRLRHEAAVLSVARHPDVVRLLAHSEDTLRVDLVDGRPLSELQGRPDDELTRAAVVAATTLADLHDLGVVHGNVTAEQVLIDAGGRPVLCGFGGAATGCRADGPEAAADVRALAEAFMAVMPPGGHGQRILAAAASPRRPPMAARRLATLLATPPEPRRHHRVAIIPRALAAAATLALVAVAVVVPRAGGHTGPGDSHHGRPPATARAGPGDTHDAHPPATARAGPGDTHDAHPPANGPAGTACPAVDLGCLPLPRPGGVVQTPTGRYRIGRAGDLVVVGRWRCSGALPALLRPATGEIWVWDSWADPTTWRPARLVTRVPGARSIQVVAGAGGCDRLRVLPGGGEVAIHPDQPA
jgi:tRNA A-37 threonylcarbamoyl transferase component Bud32